MPYDVLIIGGGHNGLVCAAYLARAGRRVLVLEARHIAGGAAVTEEFHPGFRNSVAAYTVSLLHPQVIRDLRLAEHGLRIVQRPMSNFVPLDPDAATSAATKNGAGSGSAGGSASASADSTADNALRIGPNMEDTVRAVARFSCKDAEALPRYYAMLDRLADELRKWILKAPPDPNAGIGGIIDTLKTGLALRGLPQEAQRDLIDLFGRSAGEMLDDWFETDALKAALGFDSIVGAYASPYSPGSAYVQLHHCFGEVNGKKGAWGHAIGGMGAITQAMARECERLGVTIRLNAKVARVITHAGRATGVVLDSGEEIQARSIAANVGPKLLFNQLIDANDLPPAFVTRMQRFKTGSGVLRMNVALSELPDLCGLGTQQQAHHGAGIILAPSLGYMHRAYEDARATGMSAQPVVEVLIPSTLDDTLAPKGQHVASLFCQSFAPQLPTVASAPGDAGSRPGSNAGSNAATATTATAGQSWDAAREHAADLVIDTVTRFAPNFKRSVIARQVLTPLDLERTFGLTDGDIFHGRLSLEQLFASRPMLGYANYRTPLKGLYLCGAGAHPGGGVTGAPGHNAAQAMLRDHC